MPGFNAFQNVEPILTVKNRKMNRRDIHTNQSLNELEEEMQADTIIEAIQNSSEEEDLYDPEDFI